jgi:hypothetical protein
MYMTATEARRDVVVQLISDLHENLRSWLARIWLARLRPYFQSQYLSRLLHRCYVTTPRYIALSARTSPEFLTWRTKARKAQLGAGVGLDVIKAGKAGSSTEPAEPLLRAQDM